MVCTLPLLLLIGIVTGTIAGLHPTSIRDRVLSTGAQTTLATPDFAVTTILLIVLAEVLNVAPAVSLVPPGGIPFDRPASLLVPTLAIATIGGAWLQRLVRAAVVDAAALPHVHAAHLAGYHPVSVAIHQTLPAAVGPILQACAATVPYAVTGTVVVENVVGFPGIGTLIATFIAARETIAVATPTAVLAGHYLCFYTRRSTTVCIREIFPLMIHRYHMSAGHRLTSSLLWIIWVLALSLALAGPFIASWLGTPDPT